MKCLYRLGWSRVKKLDSSWELFEYKNGMIFLPLRCIGLGSLRVSRDMFNKENTGKLLQAT